MGQFAWMTVIDLIHLNEANHFKINATAYQISSWLSDFMHPSLDQNCILLLCNVAIIALVVLGTF